MFSFHVIEKIALLQGTTACLSSGFVLREFISDGSAACWFLASKLKIVHILV